MERTGNTSQPYRAKDIDACLPDFIIGHGKTSQTKILKSYVNEKVSANLVFCDMPGYKDTESILIDIATSVWINRIAEIANSIRFVLMIQRSTLSEDRGKPFRELLVLIVKLLRNKPQERPLEIAKSILFLFTHMSDPYEDEQEEEDSLKYIQNEVAQIINDVVQMIKISNKTPIELNLLRIINKHLNDKSRYVRVLNPITTNIREMAIFIHGFEQDGKYRGLVPLDKNSNSVQCALSSDIQLSVSYAVERLESDIKEAVVSKLEEKQAKLLNLIRLIDVFVKILKTSQVRAAYDRIMDMLIAEYEDCAKVMSKMIDSTVDSPSFHDILRDDDAKMIALVYKRLKLLLKIFEEFSIQQVQRKSPISDDDTASATIEIDLKIISHFEMEFARKCLYHKLEVLERMNTDVDYGKLFQGIKQLQSLSVLSSIFNGISLLLQLHIYVYK
jgi:hypothetical protein